jgi:hypothetical protein
MLFNDRGFLVAPPDEPLSRRFFRNDCVPFSELAEKPCVVLLGEPGIGKTTALEETLASVQSATPIVPVLYRHLGAYSSDQGVIDNVFRSQEFRAWSESGGRLDVFLDSFDECLLRLDNLASLLKDQLMQLPRVDGLRIRITSRTAEWRPSLEEALVLKWKKDGEVGVYELAPLTEVQIRSAVRMNEIDDNAFLTEIINKEVIAFAIKPLTLELLIRIWKKHGALPASQREIYELGCLELCAEPNPERTTPGIAPKFTAQQRLAIASQIAAGMVFSNRSTVWRGSLPSDKLETDLGEEEVAMGSVMIDGTEFPVSKEGVGEALRTGLFTARDRDRLGLSHQTFLEFLAARWVRLQRLTYGQACGLLFNSVDPDCRVVPQLHEVASWIASDRPELFQHLSRHEPDILLRSDVSNLGAEVKRDLVAGILRSSLSRPWSTDWSDLRSRFRNLRYPGLAEQLREALVEYKDQEASRNEILQMAERCEVRELNTELLVLALAPEEDTRLRAVAAELIGKYGSDQDAAELLPLARSVDELKVTDNLKGAALIACWPRHMTAPDLFAHLCPEQETHSSRYTIFLSSRLAPSLKVEDLPTALEWAQRQPGPPHPARAAFSTLTYKIIHLAIENANAPNVLESVAKTILVRLRSHEFCMDYEPKPLFDLLEGKTSIRRSIAEAMLPHLEDLSEDISLLCHWGFCWVRSEDLDWLLDRLSHETSPRLQKIFASLISAVFRFSDATKIIDAAEQSQDLKAAFLPFLGTVDTRSESSMQQRSTHERHRKLTQAAAVRRQRTPISPSPIEHIAALLEKAEGGDQAAWWMLCTWMAIDECGYESNAYNIDCRSKPAWAKLPTETHARLIRAAHDYVLKADPNVEQWIEKPNLIDYAAHGGLIALHLVAAESPSTFEALSAEMWTKWCPAILGVPSAGDAPNFKVIAKELVSKAPAATVGWVVQFVKIENATQDHISVLGRLPNPLPVEVSSKLVSDFDSLELTPVCRRELLGEMVRGAAPGVYPLLRRLIPSTPPAAEMDRFFACDVCRMLLPHAIPDDWTRIWGLMQSDDLFGRTLVEGFRSEHDIRPGPLLKALDEDDLVDFWRWMQQQYPKDDPLSPGGQVSLVHSMARLRDGIVYFLADVGTAAAVDRLQALAEEYKEKVPWLVKLIPVAKDRFRRKAWIPPEPKFVFRLGQSAQLRFVDSGAQLQQVLVEAIGEIQRRLAGEVPAAPDLWNGDRPKTEEEISDWLKRQLDDLLVARGIVINREVRIHVYQRTDLHVDAVSSNPKAIANLKVIIEVKGCWHREVKTAMETQLLNTYLVNNDCRHGIFLVLWFLCDAWSAKDSRKKQVTFASSEEMRTFLERMAARLSSDQQVIRSTVLEAIKTNSKRKKSPTDRVVA